jgi:uncharacterized protein
MEMQGQRQLAVTQQQAWDALNDPSVLKQCVPGCDKLDLQEDGRYTVGMALKIGPVSAKFNGKIEMSNVNAPESYTLGFDGSGGVAGFGKGISQVKLTPNAEGTMLDYSVNAQVGGKIAQMGQRLIDGVAKSMADDFFARFDGVLQERFPKVADAESEAKESANHGSAAHGLTEATATSAAAANSGRASEAQQGKTSSAPILSSQGAASTPNAPKPKQTVPKTVWIMLAVGIFIITYFIKR